MARRLLVRVAVLIAFGALGAGPLPLAGATASSGSQVVADCNSNGQLTHHYTLVQLRAALSTMPAAVKEYTDCYDVIDHQLLAQLGKLSGTGGSDGSSGSGGSFLPTPVIVLLAALLAAGAAFGVVAVRKRAGG
jgi:hypothetical protein